MFSDKMVDILGYAAEEAIRTGYKVAGVDHLMLGLLRNRNNDACKVLEIEGFDLDDMKRTIDEHIFLDRAANFDELQSVRPTRAALRVLNTAAYEALRYGGTTILTSHLLLAISVSDTGCCTALIRQLTDYDRLTELMEKGDMLCSADREDELVHTMLNDEILGALGEQISRLVSPSGSSVEYLS